MPQSAWRPARPEVTRLIRVLVASLALLLSVPAPAADDVDLDLMHPLLQFARERDRTRDRKPRPPPTGVAGLKEAQHQLSQANPPKAGECAGSVGAAIYASLYAEVSAARAAEGDYAGAAEELRRAQDCQPHNADVLSQLAGVLFDARDYAGARAAIDASLAIEPRSVHGNRTAGNIDFVEQHWADAIARFRYVASSDEDRTRAAYGQLMYWLAQRRGGIAKPELITRTPGEGWPQPLLLYMRGQYSEGELVTPIRAGDEESNNQPDTNTDERLCEALYYVGEDYWARGFPDVARQYFAAVVNIKIVAFIEHGMALAELTKLAMLVNSTGGSGRNP